jgi:hypothetical protein
MTYSILDNSSIDFGNLSLNSNTTWSTGVNYSITPNAESSVMIKSDNNSGVIDCRGENADILLNGRSLTQTLDGIESRLAILRPDPALEKEWTELRELGDRYRQLEAEIKEKMRVWDILKK